MKSFFWKNFYVTVAMVLLTMLLFGFSLLWQVYRYAVDLKEGVLRENGLYIETLTNNYIENPVPMMAEIYKNNLVAVARLSGSQITVTATDGQIVAQADSAGCTFPDRSVDAVILENVKANGSYSFASDVFGSKSPGRHTVGLVVSNQVGETVGVVFLSAQISEMNRLFYDLQRMLLGVGVFVIVVSFIIVFFIVRTTTNPLKKIDHAARQFARGNFDVRVDIKSQDEIGELAMAFNNMAQSLNDYEKSRQNFLVNITHELRTPMTTIGGFVDGILDGTIPEEKSADYLRVISGEVKRLSRLITSILYISRLQSDKEPMNMARIDICQLVSQVMFGFEQKVGEKEIDVAVEFSQYNLFVTADPDAITRVVYNLVDNAVKFTPQGGKISIHVEKDGSKARVSVENTGEGLDEADLPYIFDRFYKADKSRGINQNGTGLGLFIVKSIVNRHGEDIVAESVKNEYCRFTFALPVAERDRGSRAVPPPAEGERPQEN